ncbi:MULTISPECIES: hypothetical protein [Aphanothece]|uniref:hypothetical protein n=1 Tax=Aphanothece TaxID=1121 RepID=UPI0039851163
MNRPRPLASLLMGLASLGLAVLVAGFIEEGAKAHLRRGNTHLAADTLAMRWSPAIFALAGALFLGRGLVQTAVLPWRRSPEHLRAPGPRRPPESWRPSRQRQLLRPAAAHGLDHYGRACLELGVEPGSSWSTIRAAWRRSLPEWHPDVGGDPELWHRRMAAYRLLEAWEELRS